jgi:hypothetical protein
VALAKNGGLLETHQRSARIGFVRGVERKIYSDTKNRWMELADLLSVEVELVHDKYK